MATPLALIALGGTFRFARIGKNLRQLVICLSGKLVIIPALVLSLAVCCGFRGAELLTLTVMYAAPVAVSSYQMAIQAEADGDLAAQIVVFSSAVAAFTLVAIIFTLRSFGLI
jgi:predicted permease